MSSSVIRAKAPAKLNLFLHITSRRDDGYHLLQSLFVPIALYDSLVFSQNALAQVRRISTIAEIPEDDDLVVKAARLLRADVCRPELGVDIDEPPPGQRASQDGPVSATLRFEDWLAAKPEAFQNRTFGPGRAALWRERELTLAELVDARGRPLPLATLRARLATTAVVTTTS